MLHGFLLNLGTSVIGDLQVGHRDVGGVVESVQCGTWHCCALTTDKILDCWGGDYYDAIPALASDYNIQAVGVGAWSTCVISTSGTVKCVGNHYYYQLGGGSSSPHTFQLRV